MMRSMIRTPMTGNVTTVVIIVLRRTVIKLYPIGDQTCSFVLISSWLGALPVKKVSLGLYPFAASFLHASGGVSSTFFFFPATRQVVARDFNPTRLG